MTNIGRIPPPLHPPVSEADRPLSGSKIQGIPTFEDYNGLISAFRCKNRGWNFYLLSKSMLLRNVTFRSEISWWQWADAACILEVLPGRPKVSTEKKCKHGKKKPGKKNWQQQQQTLPSPKLWTYSTGPFLEDAQEKAFFRKICSLWWTVQDGKQTSSKCSFLIVEGSFSIYKYQYYIIIRTHPLHQWTSSPSRLLDLRGVIGIQTQAYYFREEKYLIDSQLSKAKFLVLEMYFI